MRAVLSTREMPTQTMYSAQLQYALANLDRLTNWETRPRNSMRMSLEPMVDLMTRLDSPHLAFRVVHVTGTKGKGSVCALVEAAIRRAGVSVGRYASPHLHRVNERIIVNGAEAPDNELANALWTVIGVHSDACRNGTPASNATWFDIVTAAALLLFKAAGVSWVVAEVGLGGRHDSTNVLEGEIAVVTNVELEHTEVLGTTRAAIAHEKVGILKPGAVLVTPLHRDDEAGQILQTEAESLGCRIAHVPSLLKSSLEERNTIIARSVLDNLGLRGLMTRSGTLGAVPFGGWLLDADTRAAARLPGRLERFDFSLSGIKEIPVVMDGAHVPFNLRAVLLDLAQKPDLNGPCTAVVAMGADKDATGLLKALSRSVSRVVFTQLPGRPAGTEPAVLQSIAETIGLASELQLEPTSAIVRALEIAERHSGWVLVTGSLHLIGAVRKLQCFARAAA